MLKNLYEAAQKMRNPNSIRPRFELDEDAERGFLMAVEGNQTNLAMRYLMIIVGELQEKVTTLEEATKRKVVSGTKKEASDSA